MIRDGFDKEGTPDTNVWVLFGNPKVYSGALYLTSSDGVRSKGKFVLDDTARVTVKILNGAGYVFISPYEVMGRPDTYPGLTFYKMSYDQSGSYFRVILADQRGDIATVYTSFSLTIVAKCAGETINFYALGGTTERPSETLIASVKNQFRNIENYLYLFGGATNIDYVEAGSGRELMATLMMENIMPVMMSALSVVMIVLVLKAIIRMFKR
ncbi:MAG: hypothetical protein QW175_05725 [Candidatus Bathyarchaeia archaeon]